MTQRAGVGATVTVRGAGLLARPCNARPAWVVTSHAGRFVAMERPEWP